MACNKYISYMKKLGGEVTMKQFIDDWEPIGLNVLESMIKNNEVKVEIPYVTLTETSKKGV